MPLEVREGDAVGELLLLLLEVEVRVLLQLMEAVAEALGVAVGESVD